MYVVMRGLTLLLTVLYAATYLVLVKRPDDVLSAYQG